MEAFMKKSSSFSSSLSLKPQFEHDCPNCMLVKTSNNEDTYVCLAGNPAIVVRFGNEPEENKALPMEMARKVGWV